MLQWGLSPLSGSSARHEDQIPDDVLFRLRRSVVGLSYSPTPGFVLFLRQRRPKSFVPSDNFVRKHAIAGSISVE